MKHNKGKYREVTTLPKKALSVKEYAEAMDISHQYVYKLVREGKNKFEIVIFKGFNFIIPE